MLLFCGKGLSPFSMYFTSSMLSSILHFVCCASMDNCTSIGNDQSPGNRPAVTALLLYVYDSLHAKLRSQNKGYELRANMTQKDGWFIAWWCELTCLQQACGRWGEALLKPKLEDNRSALHQVCANRLSLLPLVRGTITGCRCWTLYVGLLSWYIVNHRSIHLYI